MPKHYCIFAHFIGSSPADEQIERRCRLHETKFGPKRSDRAGEPDFDSGLEVFPEVGERVGESIRVSNEMTSSA